MQAITYSRFGGPDVLNITEVDTPLVGPAEVLIRVRAAAVNPVDWKIMAGHLDGLLPTRFPVVPGWDVAGVVEEVGLDTPEYRVGDEVIGYVRKDWVQGGTMAEFVTAPVRTIAPRPLGLSWEESAGLPLAGLTALQTLRRVHVGRTDTVLVHGAAGGVGAVAVQLALAAGARVIATASSQRHADLAAIGAEPVAYGEGLAERVLELAPEGCTVVADYVGAVLEPSLHVLVDGGRLLSIADPAALRHDGEYMWVRPDAGDLVELARLAELGTVRVRVAETFPLDRAADAYRASIEGHPYGKLVVRMPDQGLDGGRDAAPARM